MGRNKILLNWLNNELRIIHKYQIHKCNEEIRAFTLLKMVIYMQKWCLKLDNMKYFSAKLTQTQQMGGRNRGEGVCI